ncbi:MAG TPA: AAA family ATPase [Ktedonobacteraceae bacterium]|nr:AAA family ATPase [Ktedonobacteraceae bacterium]
MALKGLPGCGKSTLGRTLSKQLGWPLIDKDDIKDIIDEHISEAGGLAYDTMFNIARRQLLQELNVICDSPLNYTVSYEKAQQVAAETQANLAIIECFCSDEQIWSQRINTRKSLQLPAHHQADWEQLRPKLGNQMATSDYPILHPLMSVDTIRPLDIICKEVIEWLASLSALEMWHDPVGAWSDLPDTMLEDLEKLRHPN